MGRVQRAFGRPGAGVEPTTRGRSRFQVLVCLLGLARSRSAQGGFRGFGVRAGATGGSAGNRAMPTSGFLPPPPLHHPSPPGFKQSSGDRWSNRKLFITPLLFPSRLGSAEKRRGRCLCSGVASVWDLLFSSQRLSGINTSSLPPSVRRSAATRHRRAEGPIDCTGLAFMIHTTEEEEDRGEAGRRDTAGAGTIKDGRGRRRPRGQRSP